VARRGLDGAISPLSGTLIRMLVATLCLWIFTLAARRWKDGLAVVKDRKALVFTTAGAVTGPFLGVWLSLVAVQHAKVGVASALMALVPILILPLVRIVFHERVSPRALLGTLATIGGVILLLGIG
jgi:drug/metabolite transporter (DMT)-like permease